MGSVESELVGSLRMLDKFKTIFNVELGEKQNVELHAVWNQHKSSNLVSE